MKNTVPIPLRSLEHLIKAFPFPSECVQTHKGREFTKLFRAHGGSDKPTLFQVHLEKYGIRQKLIRPFTSQHNRKVERSHRKDNERFYATHTFYSFADFSAQLKGYNCNNYNNFPMRPLGWKTPKQVLRDFQRSVQQMFDKPTSQTLVLIQKYFVNLSSADYFKKLLVC